jgi:hypothetical protein
MKCLRSKKYCIFFSRPTKKKTTRKDRAAETTMASRLSKLGTLLPKMPISKGKDPMKEITLVLIDPADQIRRGRIYRLGEALWSVEIEGQAHMDCNDVTCILNFFRQYEIDEMWNMAVSREKPVSDEYYY